MVPRLQGIELQSNVGPVDTHPLRWVDLSQAGRTESSTPEFNTAEQARTFLVEQGFEWNSNPKGEIDIKTGSEFARRMQQIKRAAQYEDGTYQSNAEHNDRLLTFCLNASNGRQDLDRLKIIGLAHIHDLKEVFSGDTPIFDSKLEETKVLRETAAIAILTLETYKNDAFMRSLINEYEAGESPEAKYVYAMDKLEPVQFALETKAKTQSVRKDDFLRLVNSQLPKTAIDPTVFDLMSKALKALGKKWIEWGCVPFEGNPEDIVDEAVRKIEQQKLLRGIILPHGALN